jgi:hypothetical protein
MKIRETARLDAVEKNYTSLHKNCEEMETAMNSGALMIIKKLKCGLNSIQEVAGQVLAKMNVSNDILEKAQQLETLIEEAEEKKVFKKHKKL